MDEITTIGIDLAKNIFQVHGVDASGAVVVRKAMRRVQVLRFFEALPRYLVGMEACARSHYWARAIAALGHEVRLMPPQYVKAYVKRNKNDAADAEAICEAVGRPSMRFVPVKSAEQQAVLTMHRARDLLVRQRTMLVNALRAHLAEFGIVELHPVSVDTTLSSRWFEDVPHRPGVVSRLHLARRATAARPPRAGPLSMLDEPTEPDDGLAALEPPGAISLRAGETVRVAPPVSVPLTEAVSLHTSTTCRPTSTPLGSPPPTSRKSGLDCAASRAPDRGGGGRASGFSALELVARKGYRPE